MSVEKSNTMNKENDSTNDNGKHPLERTWSLWFIETNRSKNWLENMHKVYDFNTVEDFWCLYNHIKKPDEIPNGRDINVFKEGVKPMWEDDANKRGGRWFFTNDPPYRQNLNEIWLNLLLYMIGENFDEQSDEICGIIVNMRQKGDKINIWTKDSSKKDDILAIGHKVKKLLNLPNDKLFYEAHEAAVTKRGSRVNYAYSI